MLAFFSYVALFRGVVGERVLHLEWRESYQITMAGLAATRLFSAGGAGGIVLTYWALRKAGMPRRQTACRMVAFLVLLYAVYMVALVRLRVLLRTGVLSGASPVGLTIVPAAIAGAVIAVFLLIALIPEDVERRLGGLLRRGTGSARSRSAWPAAPRPWRAARGRRSTSSATRRVAGWRCWARSGFWAANIGILWAAFHAYGVQVPLGVVVQGFFVGMVANLFPFAPGGVGAVDAGMIGTFVLFDLPERGGVRGGAHLPLIAFWLPIPPGIVAFLQLRKTVARWEEERAQAPSARDTIAESLPGTAAPITSESKV